MVVVLLVIVGGALVPQSAFSEIVQVEECQTLSVHKISSDGYQGSNIPENVIDSNFDTRWSKEGIGSWILLDMGSEKALCEIGISWYQGDQRENRFEISISRDGNDYDIFYEGTSDNNIAVQRYEDEKLDGTAITTIARYIQVVVNGNTLNDWASVTEMIVYGRSIDNNSADGEEEQSDDSSYDHEPICSNALPIEKVSAIGYEYPNLPENVIDGNYQTRWSNQGLDSWITFDFGKSLVLCSSDITWYKGNTRTNDFVISVSDNDITYLDVLEERSSRTLASQRYILPEIEARYLKITVTENTLNDWTSISDIIVYGYEYTEQDNIADDQENSPFQYGDEIEEMFSPSSGKIVEDYEKQLLLDYIDFVTEYNNIGYDNMRWIWKEEMPDRPLGVMNSQIIITNETSDTISGIIADDNGTAISLYDDGSYILVKYIHDPGFHSNTFIDTRLVNGSFTLQIPEKFQDAETIIFYTSGNYFELFTGIQGYEYLGVKINSARLEYKVDISLDPQKEYAVQEHYYWFDVIN